MKCKNGISSVPVAHRSPVSPTESWWGDCGAKSRVFRIEHKTDGYGYKQMSDAGSQTDILGDSEGCLSGNKQEHTELAAFDLFNSPILQNGGGIDLVESLRMLEIPSQPEAKTVVSCSCSNAVKSRCPPAQGVVSASRDVVGDVIR